MALSVPFIQSHDASSHQSTSPVVELLANLSVRVGTGTSDAYAIQATNMDNRHPRFSSGSAAVGDLLPSTSRSTTNANAPTSTNTSTTARRVQPVSSISDQPVTDSVPPPLETMEYQSWHNSFSNWSHVSANQSPLTQNTEETSQKALREWSVSAQASSTSKLSVGQGKSSSHGQKTLDTYWEDKATSTITSAGTVQTKDYPSFHNESDHADLRYQGRYQPVPGPRTHHEDYRRQSHSPRNSYPAPAPHDGYRHTGSYGYDRDHNRDGYHRDPSPPRRHSTSAGMNHQQRSYDNRYDEINHSAMSLPVRSTSPSPPLLDHRRRPSYDDYSHDPRQEQEHYSNTYLEERAYGRSSPAYESHDDPHTHPRPHERSSANDPLPLEAHDATAATMIEISPGVSAPLRGAQETTKAVAQNFITRISCWGCAEDVYCIADCRWALCPIPHCRTISPAQDAVDSHGLGLGLSQKSFHNMQEEQLAQSAYDAYCDDHDDNGGYGY